MSNIRVFLEECAETSDVLQVDYRSGFLLWQVRPYGQDPVSVYPHPHVARTNVRDFVDALKEVLAGSVVDEIINNVWVCGRFDEDFDTILVKIGDQLKAGHSVYLVREQVARLVANMESVIKEGAIHLPSPPAAVVAHVCSACGECMPPNLFEAHVEQWTKGVEAATFESQALLHLIGKELTFRFVRRYPEKGDGDAWPFSVTRKALGIEVRRHQQGLSCSTLFAGLLLDGDLPGFQAFKHEDAATFTPEPFAYPYQISAALKLAEDKGEAWEKCACLTTKAWWRVEDDPEVVSWIEANRSDKPVDLPAKARAT